MTQPRKRNVVKRNRRVVIEPSDGSELMRHAERELDLAGLLKPDSDYDGMIGKCVLDLVAVLSSQGHSGGSAMQTIEIFTICTQYKTLTPVTSNPDEWYKPLGGGVEEDGTVVPDIDMWQSKRDPSLFSYNGGQTWYSVDDPRWNKKSIPAWLWRRRWRKLKAIAGV